MPIVLEANYSKKIGLPGYSSHQFMLTLRTELSDLTQVGTESQRLHGLLQASVDRELQQPGWLPPGNNHAAPANGGNGHEQPRNGHQRNGQGNSAPADAWACTPKQRDLIVKIVDDNRLDKNEVEQLAMDRFGKGVKQLNKLEASGFIEELFERHPRQRNGNGQQPQRSGYAIR
jgi:hypothetical protein